jgi:pre-rRNA-processing protein TSR3
MEFIKLNQDLLDIYSTCESAEEVVQRQNEWLEQQERGEGSAVISRKRNYWEEDEDDSDGDSSETERVYAISHGSPGELPPSDDEASIEGEEEEQQLDKFGNTIER